MMPILKDLKINMTVDKEVLDIIIKTLQEQNELNMEVESRLRTLENKEHS